MNNTLGVSIVIPCFNSSWILEKLAQNLEPCIDGGAEIVFVDDGSTDGSLEHFKRLVPTAICVQQANKGLAAARNTGARTASREYLQFLDADDTLGPDKLAIQVDLAKKETLDVTYSDWRMVIVDNDTEQTEAMNHAEAPTEIVEALLGDWWCPPHAYMVRRDAYWDIGGSDETLVNAQDFDVWMRLAVAGKQYGYSPHCYVNYYRYLQRTSLARGPRRQYWSDYEKAILKIVGLLEEQGDLTPPRRRAAAKRLHMVARNVFPIEEQWFDRIVREIYTLAPDFKPSGSTPYRMAATLFGLKQAEALAARKRN